MLFKLIIFYFVMEYLRPGDIMPGLRSIPFNTFLLPLGIFLVSLFGSGKSIEAYFFSNTQGKMMLLLLGLHVLGLASSRFVPEANFGKLLQIMTALIGYVLVFFFTVNVIRGVEEIKLLMKILIFLHLFVVLFNFNVLSAASHKDFLESGTFFGDGNDFALALNVVLPFAIFIWLNERQIKKKIIFAGTSALFCYAIILTLSRGGSVGLIAAFVYFLFIRKNKARNSIILVLLGGIALLLAPEAYYKRMETLESYEEESSALARANAWKGAIKIALDHPLTGVGPGSFAPVYATQYRPEGFSARDVWNAAHSIYFQSLAELGFPGLFTVIIVILSNVKANERLKKRVRYEQGGEELMTCFNMSWTGYAVSAAFLSVLYYPHFFVLSALNVCARNALGEMKSNLQRGGGRYQWKSGLPESRTGNSGTDL